MRKIDRETYEQIKKSIPEHERRIKEDRRPGRLYYVNQQVFDLEGNLVAIHDEDGNYYGPTLPTV